MPTLFRSAEVRWFLPGASTVDAWFRQGGTLRDTPERIDRYLVLPGCDSVGIKFREGRFEVKARTSPPEVVEYAAGVRGLRDTWVKWSREVGVDGTDGASADERWAFVRKRRALRLVSLEGGAPREVVQDGTILSAGCQFELSDLAVLVRTAPEDTPGEDDWTSAEPWWSLSLEAFGAPGSESANLDEAADCLFREGFDVTLDVDRSMAYPAWLNGLL